jgi:hypothetical protein
LSSGKSLWFKRRAAAGVLQSATSGALISRNFLCRASRVSFKEA